jgi:hypothetical protein
LTEIVRHRDRFFQDWEKIRRVVFVNCNQRQALSHPWIDDNADAAAATAAADDDHDRNPGELPPLEVVSLSLEDFRDPEAILFRSDVVIFDDLLELSDPVEFILKFGCHHFHLYVLVVTQSCLGSKLYSLIQWVHSLVLLFGNSATTRLAQHLLQTFFLCSDTKAYLKSLFAICERQQDLVVLRLNQVASYRPHANVLALTRVQSLFEDPVPYCFVYAEISRSDQLLTMSASNLERLEGRLPSVQGQFLDGAFVLLPASRVRQLGDPEGSTVRGHGQEAAGSGSHPDGDGEACLKEKEQAWIKMALDLERDIEQTFPLKRWGAAKNLARALLQCNALCIHAGSKTVQLRQQPKLKYSIIDFINFGSRPAAPSESVKSDKVTYFQPLVNVLLNNDVPESFFLNKLLLQTSGSRSRRPGGRRRQKPHHAHRLPRVPPGGRFWPRLRGGRGGFRAHPPYWDAYGGPGGYGEGSSPGRFYSDAHLYYS